MLSVNRAIEFHDSTLVGVSHLGTSVVLKFADAYVHESAGQPGVADGRGWYQPAVITVSEASIQGAPKESVTLSDGSVRVGDVVHSGVVPLGAVLQGVVELSLIYSSALPCVIRGSALSIELTGEPSGVESFRSSQHRI